MFIIHLAASLKLQMSLMNYIISFRYKFCYHFLNRKLQTKIAKAFVPVEYSILLYPTHIVLYLYKKFGHHLGTKALKHSYQECLNM